MQDPIQAFESGRIPSTTTSRGRAREGRFQCSEASRPVEQTEIDRLEETIETLSYALHGLSHDLQDPIRTVRCYGEMLRGDDAVQGDPNLSEYVHLIVGATNRMHELVSRMLDYSRLLGRHPQPFGPVDMNIAVQTAVANLHLKIEERRAAVVCDPLPDVLGDTVQLSEMLQNLIANSLKYSSAAPPQIFIRAERSDGDSLFLVQDNGVGIDPQYHESIFVPFKRLHGRDIPGTGLGLAICRQIVELHGGRIWVESSPGKGTTFCFTLPTSVSDEPASVSRGPEAK